MEIVSIPLNESLKSFVDAEVASGHFGSPEDYIQALLREAQKRKARAKVEALLEEALDSGESTEWTDKDWDEIWQEIQERHARRNGNAQ